MNQTAIDQILYIQLIIARLGEKELQNWWNTDIAFEMGGADFLKRLVGEKLATLSAGEAILQAAYLKELAIHNQIPGGSCFSLFCPEPKLDIALKDRYRHLKRYPEDTPDTICKVLDPKKVWTAAELSALLGEFAVPAFQGTSFGRLIEISAGWDETDTIKALAAVVLQNEKGKYAMPYFKAITSIS